MSEVKCGTCKSCCKGEVIVLHPEAGDVVEKYDTVNMKNPLNGEMMIVLNQKPNSECVYLGETGCTIYADRPLICREFDCRKFYLTLTKQERHHLLMRGMGSQEEINAGRKRLKSLTYEERKECRDKRDKRVDALL